MQQRIGQGWTQCLGLLLYVLLLSLWGYALIGLGSEEHQGDVYRIIYMHVPAAFAAFMCSFVLFVASIYGLKRNKHGQAVLYGRAAAEVGLAFTLITLVTGSIWGKPTWGVWWTWDGRLTTTFILLLLYGGYLFLWSAVSDPVLRTKVCSILGLLIFADVPIIYKSVTWWRTLHQPPSLFQGGQGLIAGEFLSLLLGGIAGVSLLALWLIWQRGINLGLQKEIDTQLIKKSLRY